MELYLTADFNVEIYRLSRNGCPRTIIPYIGLTFQNTRRFQRDGFIEGDGDFAPDDVVINIFKEAVVEPYNFNTLAEIGTPTGNKSTRIKFFSFQPSVENLSVYLFELLKPLYDDYNIKLVSVHVRDGMYTTSYPQFCGI